MAGERREQGEGPITLQRRPVRLNIGQLEKRIVLDATAAFLPGDPLGDPSVPSELTLSGFDLRSDHEESLSIIGVGDDLSFALASGQWQQSQQPEPFFIDPTGQTLTIAAQAVDRVRLNPSPSPVEISQLSVSDSAFELVVGGEVAFNSVVPSGEVDTEVTDQGILKGDGIILGDVTVASAQSSTGLRS